MDRIGQMCACLYVYLFYCILYPQLPAIFIDAVPSLGRCGVVLCLFPNL